MDLFHWPRFFIGRSNDARRTASPARKAARRTIDNGILMNGRFIQYRAIEVELKQVEMKNESGV
ncbi:hypothetical protein [Burkholderia contaminans]|uniref:hypothetical protein n=1 Tax=Burkholderia contaminans TaxID=488447 RepID=UPI000F5B5CC2|nr:hypothetical protein [Burkholderia contaminans]